MKNSVEIKNNDGKTVFKGNILDLPLKDDYVIKRSVELFDDDDPCIIHRSYINKTVVDELMKLFNGQKVVQLKDYADRIGFLNIPDAANCTLYIGG